MPEEIPQKKDELSFLGYSFQIDHKKAIPIAAAAAISVWSLNLIIGSFSDGARAGTFGDMFGVSNSLFTGMAFIGVVWSVFMQREELSISREEIRKTKEILNQQQDNLFKQNIAIDKKSKEDTFFQLFSHFNEITKNITFASSGSNETGKKALDCLLNELRSDCRHFEYVSLR